METNSQTTTPQDQSQVQSQDPTPDQSPDQPQDPASDQSQDQPQDPAGEQGSDTGTDAEKDVEKDKSTITLKYAPTLTVFANEIVSLTLQFSNSFTQFSFNTTFGGRVDSVLGSRTTVDLGLMSDVDANVLDIIQSSGTTRAVNIETKLSVSDLNTITARMDTIANETAAVSAQLDTLEQDLEEIATGSHLASFKSRVSTEQTVLATIRQDVTERKTELEQTLSQTTAALTLTATRMETAQTTANDLLTNCTQTFTTVQENYSLIQETAPTSTKTAPSITYS